ncbi:MAG: methyltransferase [Pseudonocardia sp.]|mgnify:FL=1|jgi:release factor glutamine methyltransferase|uniref:HemK2/MTQ2 family protein methyltransferase n=1 Tax=Pseudonocardia sp. TaxID=60912 RepID=UPI001AD4157C|nr:HemK2/MTQ2 family protein methyltransferase [Pseudonocardia sp.]MBN9098871.1 methyltransferase [Pseudonocardia sp.]
MLLRAPGVYRAQDDTSLLVDELNRGGFAPGRAVLDVGTGSGALAVAAARAGASAVTAVDLSLRSVLTARANARLHGARVTVHQGDLFAPVAGQLFDLVLTNPPYVPSRGGVLPRHRIGRSWDGGPDGRMLLDRICAAVPAHLAPGGVVLLVQSELSGEDATLDRLADAGLDATVRTRARIPLGPVLRRRLTVLRRDGLMGPDQDDEGLVVIEARRPG